MRIIIFSLSLSMIFFHPVMAATTLPKTPELRIAIQHHHGTQFLELYRKQGEWICKTNDRGYYPALKTPYTAKELEKIYQSQGLEKSPPGGCDGVTLLAPKNKPKRYSCWNQGRSLAFTGSSDTKIKEFVRHLFSVCGGF